MENTEQNQSSGQLNSKDKTFKDTEIHMLDVKYLKYAIKEAQKKTSKRRKTKKMKQKKIKTNRNIQENVEKEVTPTHVILEGELDSTIVKTTSQT
uniref:Uncharacterized protein n=1 Tax=Ciona intestinalis TaxID=7719 RepID=H2XW09_CIOIN